MLTVITGWSPSGYHEYGEMFLHAFAKYWPESVRLEVYVEANHPIPEKLKGRAHLIDLFSIPRARETLELYDTPERRGRVPTASWKERAVKAGYNFRYDAWKFCRQGLIPLHAATRCDTGDHLLWLDGDTVTTAPIKSHLQITSTMPPGHALAYLGREPKHSEIGWQLYRVPDALPMLAEFSNLFTSGEILRQKEWHSAYAFDIARARSGIKAYNMTPGGSGDVWTMSPLQRFMVHNKGDRKLAAQRAFYGSGGK